MTVTELIKELLKLDQDLMVSTEKYCCRGDLIGSKLKVTYHDPGPNCPDCDGEGWALLTVGK